MSFRVCNTIEAGHLCILYEQALNRQSAAQQDFASRLSEKALVMPKMFSYYSKFPDHHTIKLPVGPSVSILVTDKC